MVDIGLLSKYNLTTKPISYFHAFSYQTEFPIVRGRVELLHVPKWSDSSCKTVAFPPYRFYPDKRVHVQITVSHIRLNDSVTVHDAVTSWTERMSPKNFTVCAMQSGRKEENFNPFATIDWVAYQGAPLEGLTGTIQLQKWWSGTNCADVTFPKVGMGLSSTQNISLFCYFDIFLQHLREKRTLHLIESFKTQTRFCSLSLIVL